MRLAFGIWMAEWTGLEPATPCVTGRYSNRLNYHSVRTGYNDHTISYVPAVLRFWIFPLLLALHLERYLDRLHLVTPLYRLAIA